MPSLRPPARRLALSALLTTAIAGAVAAGAGSQAPAPTIAYSSGAATTGDLWLMNVDAGSRRRLTRARYWQEMPSWSPDGTRLAYADTRSFSVPGLAARQIQPRIAVLTLHTGRTRVLTSGNVLEEDPAWSPDGARIAWTRTVIPSGTATSYGQIWIMRSTGAGPRRLTATRVNNLGAAWSPNGKLIAFTRLRSRTSDARDVWVMHPDGTHQRRLIRNASRAAWSPDGAWIAYGRPTGLIPSCGCSGTDLMVARSSGSGARLLVRNGGRPTWSSDGRRIVLQRIAGRVTHLWIVDADGSGLRQLTRGSGTEYAAAWKPGS